jgi:hypothetical protein
MIAMTVGFLLTAGFVGMAAVVLPGVLLMVVAGFGLLIMFVAQYFLWAKWLFPIVQRWEREENMKSGVNPLPTDESF